MVQCANFVASNSGDLRTISGSCFDCWSEFFKAMFNQPSEVKSACSADATSDQCVHALTGELIALTACSGLNPIGTDFEFIRNSASRSEEKSGSALSFAALITVTFAILAF